jgi:uroporphyrinogen III methyltransferase/synthase
MLAGTADCIAFTSPSTVKNLALLFDTHDLSKSLGGIKVACIGSVTAVTAKEFGLHVDIQPETSKVAALAQAIAEFYSN